MRVALVLILTATVAGAAKPQAAATQPEDPVVVRAKQMLAEGKLAEIAAMVEPRLRELVAHPNDADIDELVRLAAVREFSRYFSRVPNLSRGHRDTLNWLASHNRFAGTLMMTISEGDPPDHVLEVFRALRADHRQQLNDNAELASAMCVVWDAPERYGQDVENVKVDPAIVSSVFGRLLKLQSTREDWRNPELLVYVVDLDLTDAEMDWAAGRFGRDVSIPRLFASIPYAEGEWYDRRNLYERLQTDPDERTFVLPNLVRRGGPCADVAYATAQIARCAGVPCAVVRAAEAGDGAQPAWVAYMTSSSPPSWDMHSARYAAHADWPGEIIDPQTYAPIDDSELALIAAATRTGERERYASMAMMKAIDLATPEQLMGALMRAVEWWPTNRRAWHAMAVLEADGKFKPADAEKSSELMEKHLLREFPQFFLELRLRTLVKAGTLAHAAGMNHLRELFRGRPALLAQVELAAGDRLREDKRRPEAVVAYLEALKQSTESPATAFRAINRLDDLLRHMDDDGLARLQAIYAEVFPKLTPPRQSRMGATTPYYRIGARYAAVLDELKQEQAALAVRAKIDQVMLRVTE